MRELQPGVYLQVDPTAKFKTVNFTINFLEPLNNTNGTKRSLLAQILEDSSAAFRTPDLLATELENLYGSDYSFSHFVEGQTSILSISGIAPAKAFLPEQNSTVLPALVNLVKHALFQPAKAQASNAFDTQIFQREQTNLLHDVQSQADDKQVAATRQLKKLYFGEDSPLAISNLGDPHQLQGLTSTNLWQYFQKMLADNLIVIIVTGDLSEAEAVDLFNWSQWQARTVQKPPLFYQHATFPEVRKGADALPVVQGKLNLMYQVPVKYYHEHYFDFLLANTIFGGSAQSLLFLNIREKQSLAYYASSSLNAFTGTIMVQTGINSEQQPQVLQGIKQQLAALQAGEFSPSLLENAQQFLIDQFAMRSDSPFGRNLRYLFKYLEPDVYMQTIDFTQAVNQVTVGSIQAAATQFKLQAIYVIERRQENGTT